MLTSFSQGISISQRTNFEEPENKKHKQGSKNKTINLNCSNF